MMRHALILGIASVVTMVGPARADSIFLIGKKPITGITVVSEDAKVVKYTKGASSRRREVASREVSAVVYTGQPRSYRKGIEYFNLGDYANAVQQFESCLGLTEGPPWLKEYASVFLGRSLLASGRYDKAVSAFQTVQRMGDQSRWIGPVSGWMARAQAARGDTSGAKSTLDSFKNAARSKNLDGNWEAEADVAWGDALITAKRYDEAIATLNTVATKLQSASPKSAPAKARLRVRAESLIVLSLVASNNVERANLAVKKLETLGKTGFGLAQAAARNGRAEIDLKKGGAPDAIAYGLAQARVENFAAVSEMPRTCYLLGLAYLRLAGRVPNAKETAKSYFNEVRQRFPESREALLARDELKKL